MGDLLFPCHFLRAKANLLCFTGSLAFPPPMSWDRDNRKSKGIFLRPIRKLGWSPPEAVSWGCMCMMRVPQSHEGSVGGTKRGRAVGRQQRRCVALHSPWPECFLNLSHIKFLGRKFSPLSLFQRKVISKAVHTPVQPPGVNVCPSCHIEEWPPDECGGWTGVRWGRREEPQVGTQAAVSPGPVKPGDSPAQQCGDMSHEEVFSGSLRTGVCFQRTNSWGFC